MDANLVFVDAFSCDYCFGFEGFIAFNAFGLLGVVLSAMELRYKCTPKAFHNALENKRIICDMLF